MFICLSLLRPLRYCVVLHSAIAHTRAILRKSDSKRGQKIFEFTATCDTPSQYHELNTDLMLRCSTIFHTFNFFGKSSREQPLENFSSTSRKFTQIYTEILMNRAFRRSVYVTRQRIEKNLKKEIFHVI